MFLGPLPPPSRNCQHVVMMDEIFLKNNLLILYNAFT